MRAINEITLRTCHDIRHWTTCDRCKGIGDNREMIRVDGGSHYHRICFKRRFGLEAVLRLPAAERGRFTLREVGAVGMRKLLDL